MTAPAAEIRAFACLIPAGTPQSAPVTVDMSMPARIVREIEVLVPPGPNGLMGFQIANSGIQIIPYNAGGFVLSNNETMRWPLVNYASSGSWQLIGYNTGIYDHTVYVRFLLSLVTDTAPAASPTVDLAALNLVGDQSDQDTAAAQAALDELDQADGADQAGGGLFDPAALGPADQAPSSPSRLP